ncbi:AraC family transcriptional regulator ligand-binding domain-containing protein [Hahella sp. NBU794]|uniref:AraC family transcriptional regulator n=1 Tax=Hahella sp. NBU794 TaxID=3422590 RepID=UPI003D6EB214
MSFVKQGVEPSIHCSFVFSYLAYLRESRLDEQALVDAVKGLRELLDERCWVPARMLNELTARALSETRDPYMGLRFGAEIDASTYSILGYIVSSAPSVEEALSVLRKAQRAVSSIGELQLVVEEDAVTCVFKDNWPRKLMLDHLVEAFISCWKALGSRISGIKARATLVTFKHAPVGDPVQYEKELGCRVSFHSPVDSVRFSLEGANRDTLCVGDTLVFEALKERLLKMLGPGSRNVSAQVNRVLANLPGELFPSMEMVASQLGMEPIELGKQLKSEQASFRMLLDRRKFMQTLALMQTTKLDLAAIAVQVGFSEQSALSRAFQRWTGMPPAQYREMLQRQERWLRRQRGDSSLGSLSPELSWAPALNNRNLPTRGSFVPEEAFSR